MPRCDLLLAFLGGASYLAEQPRRINLKSESRATKNQNEDLCKILRFCNLATRSFFAVFQLRPRGRQSGTDHGCIQGRNRRSKLGSNQVLAGNGEDNAGRTRRNLSGLGRFSKSAYRRGIQARPGKRVGWLEWKRVMVNRQQRPASDRDQSSSDR